MKYSLVAEAVLAAVFLSLAEPAAAINAVKTAEGNYIYWDCEGETCGDSVVIYDEPQTEVDPYGLYVYGSDVMVGNPENWQSIKGIGQLSMDGDNLSVYVAETDLTYQLGVSGTATWYGAPITMLHNVKRLSFSVPTDDSQSISRLDMKSGFMALETLEWSSFAGFDGAELVLHGFDESVFGEGMEGNGAMLAVKEIRHELGAAQSSTMSIRLEGNSALALGEAAYAKYAGSGREGVKKLKAAITDADIQDKSGRPTLVTSSPLVDGLGKGVIVSIGTTQQETVEVDDDPKVVIGPQGRWILDLTADVANEAMLLAAEEAMSTPVTAQAGAELYLAGWDGGEFELELDESWNDNTTVMLANSPFLSKIRLSGGTLSIERRPWSTMSGLAAREIAEEAESYFVTSSTAAEEAIAVAAETSASEDAKTVATAPIGAQFMRNVMMSVATVQSETLAAREIDDTVFLAGTAGLLKSVDNAQRRTHETILSHDSGMETEADLYWWVSAYMGHGSTDKLCSGTRRDSREDFYGGTLGADYRFTPNLIGTLAVSGATADIETQDIKNASLTLAAASASLSYAVSDRHQMFAAATYSQTQAEATRISSGYRTKTEPEFRQLTADIGWKAHYAMESAMHIRPTFSIGWEQGRMRKGDVALSDQLGTNSGIGFEQSVDNRQVWHARGHLDVSGRFTVFGYNVEPGMNAGLTVYAGDTDWTVSSRLAEGSAVSKKSFHSGGHWHATGGLSLTISDRGREPIMEGGIFGFGVKNSGKTRPYDWCMTVFGSAEAGAYGSRAASFGVRYREIF